MMNPTNTLQYYTYTSDSPLILKNPQDRTVIRIHNQDIWSQDPNGKNKNIFSLHRGLSKTNIELDQKNFNFLLKNSEVLPSNPFEKNTQAKKFEVFDEAEAGRIYDKKIDKINQYFKNLKINFSSQAIGPNAKEILSSLNYINEIIFEFNNIDKHEGPTTPPQKKAWLAVENLNQPSFTNSEDKKIKGVWAECITAVDKYAKRSLNDILTNFSTTSRIEDKMFLIDILKEYVSLSSEFSKGRIPQIRNKMFNLENRMNDIDEKITKVLKTNFLSETATVSHIKSIVPSHLLSHQTTPKNKPKI